MLEDRSSFNYLLAPFLEAPYDLHDVIIIAQVRGRLWRRLAPQLAPPHTTARPACHGSGMLLWARPGITRLALALGAKRGVWALPCTDVRTHGSLHCTQGDVPFPTHRLVLAAWSPQLRALFTGVCMRRTTSARQQHSLARNFNAQCTRCGPYS